MSFGTLDRKTAILWISGVAVILIFRFFVLADRSPAVVAASESAPMAEKRLERLRQIAATVPGKEALMKQASGELESREKGMLKAETGAQAQAQCRNFSTELAPPMESTSAASRKCASSCWAPITAKLR